MHAAVLTSRIASPARRAAPWLPLALVLALIVASFVTGRGPVPSGHGAAYVGVNASLAADIYVDASGCSASAVAIGELLPGDPWKTAQDQGGQACAIDFGTVNNTAGTTLTMLESPTAPATPTAAMKCVGPTCSGDSIADYEGTAEPAPGTSAFGAQLLSAGGLATPVWPLAPAVNDVQDAASTACSTSTAGDGTCTFTFGATAETADVPGAYQAQAQLVVLAN